MPKGRCFSSVEEIIWQYGGAGTAIMPFVEFPVYHGRKYVGHLTKGHFL